MIDAQALRTLGAQRRWDAAHRLDVPDLASGRQFYRVLAEVFELSMWEDPDTGDTFLADERPGCVRPVAVLRPGGRLWPGDPRHQQPVMQIRMQDVRPSLDALLGAGATLHHASPEDGLAHGWGLVTIRDPFGCLWRLLGTGPNDECADLTGDPRRYFITMPGMFPW